MAMIKINGVDIATPKVFGVDINDIDGETERNAQGDMMRDKIAVKKKLNMEWPPLENNEISVLLNAVKDVFFQVTYPDPSEGETTKTMYVGTRTAAMYNYNNGDPKWEGLKMNFIER
jgi:hypothetical protein